MSETKLYGSLTPEVIKAVADNADTLKSILNSEDEKSALESKYDSNSPRLIKYKLFLCNVWIENKNSVNPDK